MGLSYAKKSCLYLLPFEHNVRIYQTDRQSDHGTVTSITKNEIAFSDIAYLQFITVHKDSVSKTRHSHVTKSATRTDAKYCSKQIARSLVQSN